VKTKRGEVTFAYSSTEATPLQLYVELVQTVDVLGMSGCFTFAVYQEE
jgi:hypothetical protein